jgi:hypothetical protein
VSTTVVSVEAIRRMPVGVVGGVTSRQAPLETVVDVMDERLPAVSNASTPTR